MDHLPSGTVTFLFTDIEGSTARWERERSAMQGAVARHDALLRAAIEGHRGTVFKTVGDAFCAVFSTADDAVQAALAGQRALSGEPWPSDVAIRARMALHTGMTEERDGDYFGPAVNRVARLLAAGHGGQILLSAASAALVEDSLPPGSSLIDLGQHRLKDLTRPEHIFQLAGSDLRLDHPPLRTLEAQPNNLPIQVTPFLGRTQELHEIAALLQREHVRLVTLTGPGGTGKTRLALQAGADALDRYPDGVFFVGFADIADFSLVPGIIAAALGVPERTDEPILALIIAALTGKRTLLILDNLEHLPDAGPPIAQLLSGCPQLTVLATSRTPLHLTAEREYAVPTLDLPDPAQLPPLDALERIEAIALFVDRAQAAKPGFALTTDNGAAVAAICRELDGLPLAIELAAARVKLFPPAALLARLSNRLKLLTGGSRDLPERQQTLRSAIDWSYSLLSAETQTIFSRLAVFAGGCTFDAVESVCNPEGELDVLDGLTTLVDQSLVRQEGDTEPRFRMLQTIREYASEKLDERGERVEMRAAHAAYVLALAERSRDDLTGPKQAERLQELDAELDNIRAALDYFLERGEIQNELHLAASLRAFWYRRGYWMGARQWLQEGLQRGAAVGPDARAEALWALAQFVSSQGDHEAADAAYEQAIGLFRESGNDAAQAEVLVDRSVNAIMAAALDRADRYLGESLQLARRLNEHRTAARALMNLGKVADDADDLLRAKECYEEALATFRRLGDRGNVANVLISLGHNAQKRESPDEARVAFEESLTIAQELGAKYTLAFALDNLATLSVESADYRRAAAQYAAALRLCLELGDKRLALGVIGDIAEVACLSGDPKGAAQLLGAEQQLREQLGIPFGADEYGWIEIGRGVREKLGNEATERELEAGRQMTFEQAMERALHVEAALHTV